MSEHLPIICILGSTCTGKTELAINLQKRFPIEIISVDSAMIYREMNIGTDKPAPEILDTIKHHLIDIRNPDENYNVADFCSNTVDLIGDIHKRKKIPLLAGGSLMYFHSLYNGLSCLPNKNISDRSLIDHLLKKYSLKDLHDCLNHIDDKSFKKIQTNDKQRIQRALEVYMTSGRSISSFFDDRSLPLESFKVMTIKIHSDDRSIIHEKISTRINHMFDEGLIEEADHIIKKFNLHSNSQSMKVIGYRQIMEYLADKMTLKELKSKCLYATRQLAKRQITWLKQFPCSHAIDILNNDPTIIYKLVDSHCNLGK